MRIIIEFDNGPQSSQPSVQLQGGSDTTAITGTTNNANATDAGGPGHLSGANQQAETIMPDSFTSSAIPDSVKAEATNAGAAPGS